MHFLHKKFLSGVFRKVKSSWKRQGNRSYGVVKKNVSHWEHYWGGFNPPQTPPLDSLALGVIYPAPKGGQKQPTPCTPPFFLNNYHRA